MSDVTVWIARGVVFLLAGFGADASGRRAGLVGFSRDHRRRLGRAVAAGIEEYQP